MTRVENGGQISNLSSPVKLRKGIGEISESVFRARRKIQPLIYLWRGPGSRSVWEISGLLTKVARQ